MCNTFERDMLANERHQGLLRAFTKRQLTDEATRADRATGLLTTLFGRRRDTATTSATTAHTA